MEYTPVLRAGNGAPPLAPIPAPPSSSAPRAAPRQQVPTAPQLEERLRAAEQEINEVLLRYGLRFDVQIPAPSVVLVPQEGGA